MKFIRIQSKKIACVLSLSLLLFSCSKYEDFNDNTDSLTMQRTGERYTGEEIISGIFFFQNEISDNIAFLREFKDNLRSRNNYYQSLDELKKMSELSINYIKKNNPNFLDEFQNVIYSNNYYEINKKMNEAVVLMTEALKTSDDYSEAVKYAQIIENNDDLKNYISTLDLSQDEDKAKLKLYLESNPELQYSGDKQMVTIPIFVGAAAVAYTIAAVVSIAAVLYSVYVKVAYWDIQTSEQNINEVSITRENAVKEISTYFQNN